MILITKKMNHEAIRSGETWHQMEMILTQFALTRYILSESENRFWVGCVDAELHTRIEFMNAKCESITTNVNRATFL